MIRDNTYNMWDMDPSTNNLETNGTWHFGIEPSGATRDFFDFEEIYN